MDYNQTKTYQRSVEKAKRLDKEEPEPIKTDGSPQSYRELSIYMAGYRRCLREGFEMKPVVIEPVELKSLINKSVVTYRAASWWGNTDYKCVEILMEKENFDQLERLLGSIDGRIGKQYEGGKA